jgi:hypothetical protein
VDEDEDLTMGEVSNTEFNELFILPDINWLTYATNVFQDVEFDDIPSIETTSYPSSSNLLSAEF